ncbi:MAG: carbohydrate-binding family 9-like protein [Bacteroidaceae bacterium]
MNNHTLFLRMSLIALMSPLTLASASKPVGHQDPKEIVMPSYTCRHTTAPITVDGKLDEAVWESAAWSHSFVDIEGISKPKPKYDTRLKMVWDDEALYIAAKLIEPNIWSTISKRDATIYWDNDFEVFIDPNGTGQCYFEYEMNAQNTPWDLLMTKPYYQGGTFLNGFDIKGLQNAVHIQGTLNDPSDTDDYWTVEIRIPFKSLNASINKKSIWRMNFSRVEWLQVDVKDGKYVKRPGTEASGNEENWVWAPTGVVDIHRPSLWGFVYFVR